MAWLDFLGNIGNNVKTGTRKLFSNLMQEKPELATIQMADNGGLDVQGSLKLGMAMPKSLKDKMLGRTVSVDVESTNPETNEMEVSRVSKFQPGLLNDIAAGARENFATGFAAPNWEESRTPDGRTKGFGYRFGEGSGSMAKFAESPLGRSLLMGAIVGASGGSGLEALGYGAGAGLGNQQARMKDKMYRNELEKMGFDTTGITGYVGDDTFNKIFQSKQLQDNAEYRNAMLASQQRNQEALLEQRRQEQAYREKQDAIENAQRWAQINSKNKEQGAQNKAQDLDEMQAQLNDFVSTFDSVDNPYRYRIAGGVSNVLNTLTPEEANFNAKRTLLFNAIARKLADEKGVLSDQDIKRIDDALPKLADTKKQKMAKMDATYSLLDIRRGYKTPQAQTGKTTKSGVKYEVID